ncbi:MAG: DMT family transporter [Burkholderiaceae bacterium]|nr:DMT family transporter [Burkholderiaceae bacterium]
MTESSSHNSQTPRLAVLALIVLALIWSYNWVVMKWVLQYVGAIDFAALRAVFGAALLLVMLPLSGRSLKPPPWRPVLWIGLWQVAGMAGLSQLALVSGGAGKTAVLVYTMPFWMLALAAWLLNEKPRPLQIVAAGIAAAGLLFVLRPWQWQGSWLSSMLAVGSGAAWAAGSVAAKRAFRHQAIDLLQLTTWQMVVGATVLATLALATHEQPIVWSLPMLGALAYNAVLGTALGWGLWLFVMRSLPAGVAGLSTLATPVLSVLWAVWLLGERPGFAESIGITLILLALALLGASGIRQAALRHLSHIREGSSLK